MYARQNGRVLEIVVTNAILTSEYSLKSQHYPRRQSASVRPSDVHTRPQAVGPPEPSRLRLRPGQAEPQVRTSSGRFARAHGSG